MNIPTHTILYPILLFFSFITTSFGQLDRDASTLLLEGRKRAQNFDSLLQQLPERKWIALSGVVWDSLFQTPLIGADINTLDNAYTTFTDLQGYFYLPVLRSKDTMILQINSLYCTSQFPIVPSHTIDTLFIKSSFDCRN